MPEGFDGERLRRARMRCGLSQRALAQAAQVPYETLSRLERGRQAPSWQTAVKLVRVLAIPLDDLVAPLREGTVG